MDSKILAFKRPVTVREALSAIGREVREPQIQMAELIARALEEKLPAIVEAGTGTGKTWGYLIPALIEKKRLLVTTHTITLQEQIFNKDIPYLQEQLDEHFGIEFSAAVLKGASNYLCVRKFEEATGGLFPDHTIPADVVAWGRSTATGELAEAPEMEDATRAAIAVDLTDCDKKDCPFWARCHMAAAQSRAANADLVIMNHAYFAMLRKNPAMAERIGAFDGIVVDEGHQLEEVLRAAAAGTFSPAAVSRLLDAIQQQLVPAEEEATTQRDRHVRERWAQVRDGFRAPALQMLLPFANVKDPLSGDPAPEEQLIDVRLVRQLAGDVRKALLEVGRFVSDHANEDEPEHAKISRQVENLGAFFDALASDQAIAVAKREIKPGAERAKVTLETFPLSVAPELQDLYKRTPVIFTSATISAGGSFTAIKEALGLPETTLTADITSPFDYPSQALLYVPRVVRDQHEEIARLLTLSKGRAFVLFTSNSAMRNAFNRYRLRFPAKMQGTGSKQALVDWFKKTPNAVLFGTASFWEGVSIEGEQLSLVIIDKLPFPVPTDPLVQAKEARLGKSAFGRLALPHCILRLKQGFGRLIRTQTDRGMVAILDTRLASAKYAGQIMRALPPARVIHNLDDRELIARYLGDGPAPVSTRTEAEHLQRAVDRWGVGF